MALLAKKLSFLPFIAARAPGSPVQSYIIARTFATRRSAKKVPAVVVDDDDDTTSTDDEAETPHSLAVQLDDAVQTTDTTTDLYDLLPCRATLPTNRRPWAVSQDENAVRLRMDMPGITKEDVKVYVDNGRLVVRGKYPEKRSFTELEENVDDGESVLGDNFGVYSAELFLPENVQKDKIKSHMKDGMLLVTAPKEVTNVVVE